MKFMYSDEKEWNEYIVPQLKQLISDYDEIIDLNCLGFPEEWEAYLKK